MSVLRAARYLQIPVEYCRSFGGLRWAQYGEAVEFLEGPAAGRTFAFDAEIARFLEGLHTTGRCSLGFGFALHLLYLIGLGDRATRAGNTSGRCLERIAEPFRALGCPLRNAGALCAWLSRAAPDEADPPELAGIHEILTNGNWVPQVVLSLPTLGSMDPVEEPGLGSEEFEALVRVAADALSDEAIRHWLRHGRGPAGSDGDRLVPIRPRSLAAALAELERTPRLTGLGRLVRRLESALCLPPRRLAWSELQTGGYADVTTRGAPEQILPIQFALDDHEFLRRFAERELLYFHREEPRQPTTEELVLLLDQGARTWGDVRLVLAGAALGLSRQAERKRIAVKLAATSNEGELVDPTQIEPRSLSALLEASDLSPHPGRALQRLLHSPAVARRDVVLLTHPRSLAEPEVAAAARSLAGDGAVRLFAVSVDSGGQVELAELRRGLPVVLGRSRINLAGDEAAANPRPHQPEPAHYVPWKGDVDPIGFPFHCGGFDRLSNAFETVNNVVESRSFDFDEIGERILVAGEHATLFTCRIDGGGAETLPPPLIDGEVVTLFHTVIGVGGGFVVVGYQQKRPVLAHYDFSKRSCTIHKVHVLEPLASWVYYRDLHSLAARASTAGRPPVAIDLAVAGPQASTTSRATRAALRAAAGVPPFPFFPKEMWTSGSEPGLDSTCSELRLDSGSGTLHFRDGSGNEQSLTPLSDGSSALKGGHLIRADRGGDVLAVLVAGAIVPGLYFISVSRSAVIGIFTASDDSVLKTFALSRDGRMFARLLGRRQLEIRDVPGDRSPLLVTPREEVRNHFAALGSSCMLIREPEAGRLCAGRCLIRWDQGRLDVVGHEAYSVFAQLGGIRAQSRSLTPGKLGPGYLPLRFVQMVEHAGLLILIDRYNHLVVLRGNGSLVCTFYVAGNEVGARLPDGTCWGSRRLIGGESTPGAAERIAAALRSAEQGEG